MGAGGPAACSPGAAPAPARRLVAGVPASHAGSSRAVKENMCAGMFDGTVCSLCESGGRGRGGHICVQGQSSSPQLQQGQEWHTLGS